MPTAITHRLLAEETYKKISEPIQKEIRSLPHYYFGAQGCDIFFAYKILSANENLGRFLHKTQPLLFFKILFEESKKDESVRSYAYGYITHYAADTVFHPHVYGVMRKQGVLLHHAIEHACDGVLLKKYGGGRSLFFYRLPTVKKIDCEGIYNVYARYAKESGWGDIDRKSFSRAIKYYYAFNNVRTPFFRRKYAASAERLFEESLEKSVSLAETFYKSTDGKFAATEFGRHYLNGKIV